MLSIVQTINAYLSDYILVFLLVAVGLWYTIKTRFVQVRCFGAGLKKIFGDISLQRRNNIKRNILRQLLSLFSVACFFETEIKHLLHIVFGVIKDESSSL